MAKEFKVHGIEFIRTGKCNQCGGCDRECLECPHGETINGKVGCKIYDKRHLECKECSEKRGKNMTHQICIDFPNHPWLRVIRSGQCNYNFKRKDKQSMDTLPFVKGKFLKE